MTVPVRCTAAAYRYGHVSAVDVRRPRPSRLAACPVRGIRRGSPKAADNAADNRRRGRPRPLGLLGCLPDLREKRYRTSSGKAGARVPAGSTEERPKTIVLGVVEKEGRVMCCREQEERKTAATPGERKCPPGADAATNPKQIPYQDTISNKEDRETKFEPPDEKHFAHCISRGMTSGVRVVI